MMQVPICFILLVVLTNAVARSISFHQFIEFQHRYGKMYKSSAEMQKRFIIYKNNLRTIANHNTLFEEGRASYTLGINQFADWTSDEFKQYIGRSRYSRIPSDYPRRVFKSANNSEKPESIDWRKQGLVTRVKDQGSCGSCWAFSATGTIEGQFAKKNGTLISFSEQNLIDCASNHGCEGDVMFTAYLYAWEVGLESEDHYPYQAVPNICRANPKDIIMKIYSYEDIVEDDEEGLVEALATVGPISVEIDATENLQFYSSGIFDDKTCTSDVLNHAVLAVGYGKENGQNYYIIKNSWGVHWGEDGYFKLMKENNRCGIASVASFPVLK